MSARPFQVVECDISKPGSESRAVANAEIAALWSEGWSIAYCWIKVQRRDENTTEESFLMVVMAPPRDEADEAEREALGALIATVVEGQTTASASQANIDRIARGVLIALGGIAVLELAQVIITWVMAASS